MPTTALQYFEQVHGPATDFLSKDAILTLMDAYSDRRFFEFQRAKEDFQTERWVNQRNSRVGKSYQKPQDEKPNI